MLLIIPWISVADVKESHNPHRLDKGKANRIKAMYNVQKIRPKRFTVCYRNNYIR